MKEHDFVKFINFTDNYEHFNGLYGLLTTPLPDNKWRVNVNAEKHRAVSATGMEVVEVNPEEKLKTPYCMIWPAEDPTPFRIHKIDHKPFRNIAKLLGCEAPKSIVINSSSVKIPGSDGSSPNFELKTLVWYDPDNKTGKINKAVKSEVVHGCCIVDFSSKYEFLEKCAPSIKKNVFSKQFKTEEDMATLCLTPSMPLKSMVAVIEGGSNEKFNLTESYEIQIKDSGGNKFCFT